MEAGGTAAETRGEKTADLKTEAEAGKEAAAERSETKADQKAEVVAARGSVRGRQRQCHEDVQSVPTGYLFSLLHLIQEFIKSSRTPFKEFIQSSCTLFRNF